jgi:hypothetical protein
MTSAAGGSAEPNPRTITLGVIRTLLERGQLEERAVPDTPVKPRTLWKAQQLRIYQVYAGSGREHGAKKRTAAELGITPNELSRQFREAEAILLEAYYVAAVLAPPATLRDRAALHRCLNIYDDMSLAPRRLGNGQHTNLYWSRPVEDQRLAAAERTLLKTAARSLSAEDLVYVNAAAAYGVGHHVRADARKAADLYRRLVAQRDLQGGEPNGARPSRTFWEEFASALHRAEGRMAELLGHLDPNLSRLPQESGVRRG